MGAGFEAHPWVSPLPHDNAHRPISKRASFHDTHDACPTSGTPRPRLCEGSTALDTIYLGIDVSKAGGRVLGWRGADDAGVVEVERRGVADFVVGEG